MARAGFIAAWLVIAALAAVTLFTIGGPGQARRDREDAQRASDLVALKDAVSCYARQHQGTLPAGLTDITDCGILQLTDRTTDQPFSYAPHPLDGSYELCAVFNDASRLEDNVASYQARWVDPETGCVNAALSDKN